MWSWFGLTETTTRATTTQRTPLFLHEPDETQRRTTPTREWNWRPRRCAASVSLGRVRLRPFSKGSWSITGADRPRELGNRRAARRARRSPRRSAGSTSYAAIQPPSPPQPLRPAVPVSPSPPPPTTASAAVGAAMWWVSRSLGRVQHGWCRVLMGRWVMRKWDVCGLGDQAGAASVGDEAVAPAQ
jgi:hypothetical protein